MSFFARLTEATTTERENLLRHPLLKKALAGRLTREHYVGFLCQAYHHVRHTVPLLMAAGSRIPAEKEWLRTALAEYVEEELGHQEWVLNDIVACGYDRGKVQQSTPSFATEMMVAYAYHLIDRGNPVGFFGMVHVLEGTSVAVADKAADRIAESAGLPEQAFSYLRSHGALDVEHVKFFEDLMDSIHDPVDRAEIIRCARHFYRLYADVYSSVRDTQAQALAA